MSSKFIAVFLLSIGTDAILLGAETLRGLYPVETISTVGKICAEVRITLHFICNLGVWDGYVK